MTGPKILALIGAVILLVGVFMPIASVPFLGDVSYLSGSRIGGVIMLALALAGGGLALSDRVRDCAWAGAAALVVLGLSYFLFERRMGELGGHMGHGLAGRLLRRVAEMAGDSVQLQWGWAVLGIGGALLVCAGLMARRSDERPAGEG